MEPRSITFRDDAGRKFEATLPDDGFISGIVVGR